MSDTASRHEQIEIPPLTGIYAEPFSVGKVLRMTKFFGPAAVVASLGLGVGETIMVTGLGGWSEYGLFWLLILSVAAPSDMRDRSLPPPMDFDAFRRENGVLILLNLGVMLGLLVLHLVFRPVLGALSLGGALALSARFLMQLGELALLTRPPVKLGQRGTEAYAAFTVAAHIAFASLLSSLSPGQESHHVVLLVIPIIAAAFWFRLPWLVLTAAVVTGLTVLQVWIPLGVLPQGQLVEYFEATTVALIFILVAGVVRILAHQLWGREEALQQSLSQLAAARDLLVKEERLAAIGKLSFAIAHEIRNPVTMIACSASAASRPNAPVEARVDDGPAHHDVMSSTRTPCNGRSCGSAPGCDRCDGRRTEVRRGRGPRRGPVRVGARTAARDRRT